MVWSVLLVRWQAFDSLRQLSHAHGDVEPVEDRFAERAEVALRLAYAVAAVGQERRWLCREHALFSQESLHAFGGLGLQSMDESKDLACAGARQPLADHALEPSFLAGQSVRSLRVPAVDADRLQRAALRLPEVVECWNGRDALMSLAIQAGTHGSDVPLPRGDTRGALQCQHSCQNAGGHPVR